MLYLSSVLIANVNVDNVNIEKNLGRLYIKWLTVIRFGDELKRGGVFEKRYLRFMHIYYLNYLQGVCIPISLT